MTLLYSESLYQLYLYSGKFSQFFCLALLIWTLVNIKHFKGIYIYAFILFMLFSVFELTRYFQWENHGTIDGIYIFVSIIAQCVFYYKASITPWLKRYIIIGIPPLLLGILVYTYLTVNLDILFIVSLESAVLLVMYFQLHRELISYSKLDKLYRNPLFWINLAFIILSVFYLLFGLLTPFLVEESKDIFHFIYSLKNLIGPISCVLWIICVWKLRSWVFTLNQL